MEVMITNLLSSKAFGRFTLMILTAATVNIVSCICIFSAKLLSVTDVKGFNYHTSILYESRKTMEGHMGVGKALPGFPI